MTEVRVKSSKRLIYGVGTKGDCPSIVHGDIVKSYNTWHSMLRRCYDPKSHVRNPSYIGCSVCDIWTHYPTFKEWYDYNYIESFQLDKDLLFKGNKIYSPETCVFVPHQINSLFNDQNKHRGCLPLGVTKHENTGKFTARVAVNGRNKHLGLYSDPLIAHQVYTLAKKDRIISLANEYRDKISSKLYDILLKRAEELI